MALITAGNSKAGICDALIATVKTVALVTDAQSLIGSVDYARTMFGAGNS